MNAVKKADVQFIRDVLDDINYELDSYRVELGEGVSRTVRVSDGMLAQAREAYRLATTKSAAEYRRNGHLDYADLDEADGYVDDLQKCLNGFEARGKTNRHRRLPQEFGDLIENLMVRLTTGVA